MASSASSSVHTGRHPSFSRALAMSRRSTPASCTREPSSISHFRPGQLRWRRPRTPLTVRWSPGVGPKFQASPRLAPPFEEPRAEEEVAAQGFEHVLPGADRIGRTHAQPSLRLHGADRIGHQPVLRPVAAADHVAGAHRGEARSVGTGEERVPGACRDHLGRRLRRAVRIGPAEGIVLAILASRAAVLVALVGGHDHDRGEALHLAARLEHVHRPLDVGLPGEGGLGIGAAHERLRGEMEHGLGPCRGRSAREIAAASRTSARRSSMLSRSRSQWLGLVGGSRAMPVTFAPRKPVSHQREPASRLKPVCPVTTTRRPL